MFYIRIEVGRPYLNKLSRKEARFPGGRGLYNAYDKFSILYADRTRRRKLGNEVW